MATISACAVGSPDVIGWLNPRPTISPSSTTTAPIGTSPASRARARLLERRRHPRVVRRRIRHAFDAAVGAIRPRADSRAPAAGTSRPTRPRPNAGIAP